MIKHKPKPPEFVVEIIGNSYDDNAALEALVAQVISDQVPEGLGGVTMTLEIRARGDADAAQALYDALIAALAADFGDVQVAIEG